MNDELLPVNIMKTETDISPSTVDVTVLDVEELLFELAEVVGLEESDVATLRRDLDAMRPSERAGFLSEVIKQERARRARAIVEADVAAEPSAPVAELSRKLTEEELDYLRERLKAMGIEDTETDLMVEQARNLTKAEVDALLDQIGGEEK
jgi:Mg/Co/Ni transporter MgtE